MLIKLARDSALTLTAWCERGGGVELGFSSLVHSTLKNQVQSVFAFLLEAFLACCIILRDIVLPLYLFLM